MRIGIDAREFGARTTGIGRYLANAVAGARALGRRDALIGFVCPGEGVPFDAETVEVGGPGPWGDLVGLGRSARRARLDAFLSPYYKVPAGLGVPAVCVVHDVIPLRFGPALRRAYFAWRLRAALRRAARVVAVSRVTAGRLAGLGVPAERIVVAPNAVAPGLSAAPSGDDAARVGRRGLAPGGYLLCVSVDRPHKNLARLAEAWRRSGLARPRPDGDGLRLAVTERAGAWAGGDAAAAGIAALGAVADDDLAALYRGARAVVCPSLDEGFGLPVVEAMACGAPIACAEAGALPETAGGAALLFDPCSIDGIAAALRRIATDEALRADLRRAGLERAARFTPAESSRPLWEAVEAAAREGP